MKKLSFWARQNKWKSRIIIVIATLLLNLLALVTGILLNSLGLIIPAWVFITAILLFLTGFIMYPYKADKTWLGKTRFYTRRKSMDFVLLASTFIFCTCLANEPDRQVLLYQNLGSTPVSVKLTPKDSTVRTYKTINEFSASMKDADGKTLKWKERKKLLKTQLQSIKNADDLSPGSRTALTILSIIVATGLLLLVLALACDLSCSGSDGAAILVGVGGTALIVWLTIVVLRSINGRKRKKETELPE